MARLLEAHGSLGRGGDAAAPLHPGDLVTLVVEATWEGEASPAFPTAAELAKALTSSVSVLGEPSVSEERSADPPGLPPGSGRARSASWPVQLLLAPGEHELGPVPLRLLAADGSEADAMEVPAVRVELVTALPDELAGRLEAATGSDQLSAIVAKELAPVRGPWSLRARLDLGEILGAGLLLLGLLAAAVLLWRRLRRRRPTAPAPPRPLLAPEAEARQRLARLPPLLDAGEHLRFHVELAEVLKRYLGRRYHVDFLESTTDEVRRALAGRLRGATGVTPVREDVSHILTACDLVKFARALPARAQCLSSLELVETVVDRTTAQAREGPEAPAEEAA